MLILSTNFLGFFPKRSCTICTIAVLDDTCIALERFIFPYQDEADAMLNTALIYELGVLHVYALPLLYSVDINSIYYDEAKRLINLLKNILPIPSDEIPRDSIIREFIGGSCYEVQ